METREKEELDHEMLLIQTNIDDMNPETYPYVLDRLFAAGARDAYLTPIIMKKGRPAVQLSVLVNKGYGKAIETIIFEETTSIGLRYGTVVCHRLEREVTSVETPWGAVGVKIGYLDGRIVNVAPEFEDCVDKARRGNVPLKRIYDLVRERMPFSSNPEEREA